MNLIKLSLLGSILILGGCATGRVSGTVQLGFRDYPEFWWPYDSFHFYRDPFYPVYPIYRQPWFHARPPYHHNLPRYRKNAP